ncbi:hypothetical protein TSUD_268650 [Trifolium subterraneum]|uniref:K-box domain-containing protein n=1 Tax=Trifolium subterraneum TaxID=3900 RepID=A0A2Z6NRA9_TRISU|nr:hypothetical protein TSUD_268650 [Trifolium subterraneum]
MSINKYFLQKDDTKMVEILKDEIAKLETNQLRLLGKDLTGLGLKELQHLEQQINEGLSSVKERKDGSALPGSFMVNTAAQNGGYLAFRNGQASEELLMEQLEQSRIQEQKAMLENETLRRQAMIFLI